MIVIPAAGHGRRFREAGYTTPKHEIPLLGDPMIDWVIENVRPLDPEGDVFVATRDRVGETAGAMETIHRALIQAKPQPGERLVIANCDQLLDLSAVSPTASIGNGIVFTFQSANPAHSYVATRTSDLIWDIIEKPNDPAAQGWNRAVSGVYLFANPWGIQTAIKDCLSDPASGGEQYLSAALKRMVDQDYALYATDVPTAILGTPEDFQRFQTAAHVLRAMEQS